MVLHATQSASAQERRFKLTVIKKLGFEPTGPIHGKAGINNLGEIVYGYNTTGQVGGPFAFQAFVWLPVPDFGVVLPGLYDLTGCPGGGDSIAHDISMNGFAAGQSGGVGELSGRAAVWSLDTGLSACQLLPAFSPADHSMSRAFALSDDAQPVVVGDSNLFTSCVCPSNPAAQSDVRRAFRATFVGAGTTLTVLTPGGDPVSSAFDVRTPADLIVGFIDCVGYSPSEGPPTNCDPFDESCEFGKDASRWTGAGNTLALETDLGIEGSEVRGLNNVSQLVGWGKVPLGGTGFGCLPRGLFWSSPGTAPTNLHSGLLPANTGSIAEAINDLTDPQVVGLDVITGFGQLWERSSGTWSVLDLDSAPAIGGATTNTWSLLRAHDINDDTWIVALGSYQGIQQAPLSSGNYLVLLTPDQRCEADLNGSGCVDIDDMLLIVNTWGQQCAPGWFCVIGDVNTDYVVDIDDLLAVVNGWCPSVCNGSPCCVRCGQCAGDGGQMGGAQQAGGDEQDDTEWTGPVTQAEVIQLVLTSSQSAEVQAEIIEAILSN